MIRSASDRISGLVATLVGVVTIFVAASGVFGEVQSALNAIWKAKSRRPTMSRLDPALAR
jgi:membrane protein